MRPRHIPLWFEDQEDFARCREAFERVGYRDDSIASLLGVTPATLSSAKGAGTQFARTEGSALGTLVRVLLMGAHVPERSLADAISPMSTRSWHDAGLVSLDSGAARPLIQLLPLPGPLLLAGDLPARRDGALDLPEDFVMGVARSTLMLADATVRREVGAALDLGTGSGFHALHAAPHARRVLGLDRNARATGFARFNARLNGALNAEFREGDLFGPAADERFDLIVTNPPFVITPGKQFIYRDSGMSGDAVVETICRRAPAHLANGGYCQLIGNWAHLKGRDWKSRLRSWFEGSSCDVWVMRSETLDAPAYASFWIRHTIGPEADRPGGAYDQWTGEYERLGIEAVSMGMIFMRKREGARNWFRLEDEPSRISGPFGHHVERAFANADFLASLRSDEDLLGARLRIPPDARAITELEPAAREWTPRQTSLTLASGLCYSGAADGHILKLLAECDGSRALREPLAKMARALMRDEADVTPPTLAIVRTMLEQGLLLAPERT